MSVLEARPDACFYFAVCACGREEWLQQSTHLCYACRGGTMTTQALVMQPPDPKMITPHSVALAEYLSPEAREMVLTDDADLAVAAQIINDVKQRRQTLEDQRKSITGPIKEGIRRFEALFKPALDACEGARSLWDGKIRDYTTQRSLERAAAEAALQVAVTAGDERAAAAAVTALVPAERISGLTLQESWTFVEQNHDIVPTSMTLLNPAAVRAEIARQVAAGDEPAIPGLRITKTQIVKATGGR